MIDMAFANQKKRPVCSGLFLLIYFVSVIYVFIL